MPGVILDGQRMSAIVARTIKNGVAVPNAPLPKGAFVEVHVSSGPIEVPPDLQEEYDAWGLASAEAVALPRKRINGRAGRLVPKRCQAGADGHGQRV
jgi:hypothetical protein